MSLMIPEGAKRVAGFYEAIRINIAALEIGVTYDRYMAVHKGGPDEKEAKDTARYRIDWQRYYDHGQMRLRSPIDLAELKAVADSYHIDIRAFFEPAPIELLTGENGLEALLARADRLKMAWSPPEVRTVNYIAAE